MGLRLKCGFPTIRRFQSAYLNPERPYERTLYDYSRSQLERLARDIEQIFEIRANSELAQPKQETLRRVFITHGRSDDWRVVQAFIEKDVRLPTTELAQEPSRGHTIIEKLFDS